MNAASCRSPSISLELGSSLDETQLLRDKISRLQQEREHLSSQVNKGSYYPERKLGIIILTGSTYLKHYYVLFVLITII